MHCPICRSNMTARTEGNGAGWYAECDDANCGLSVGKVLKKIIFFTNATRVEYAGIFKNKKELKRYVNR